MTFKNSKQRKCVMAMLKANGFSGISAKFICNNNPGIRNMNYSQLKKKGIKLKPFKDSDSDGIINVKDCKPLDKTKQLQKRILDNKKLKQDLDTLKRANFAQTRTGKVIALTTSPKVKKAARKFLKKIFK